MAPFFKPNRGGGVDRDADHDDYKRVSNGPRRFEKQTRDARFAVATGAKAKVDRTGRMVLRREDE